MMNRVLTRVAVLTIGTSVLAAGRTDAQIQAVGPGSTVQGDALRGEGVYLQGLGWYELNEAKAAAQNLETQKKLYEWNKQISADYRREYNARAEREIKSRRLTEEVKKKFLAEREQRLRTKPTSEDIEKGDALNILLADLSDPMIQESSWRGAKVPLPIDISIKLLAMRFSPKPGAKGSAELAKGLIALGRLDTQGHWPDVFPLDKLSAEIAAYETAYGKIKAQALAGRIDPSAPIELDKAIKALRDRVRIVVPVERNFRSIALKFVESLSDATRMFDGATLGFAREMISDTSEHEAHTVGELLAFMRKYRLRFAEAGESPGGEEMYARLYGLMQEQKEKLGLNQPQDIERIKTIPIKGNWAILSCEVDGKDQSIQMRDDWVHAFDGIKFTATLRGKLNWAGTYKIDLTKNPKSIDILVTEGPSKGKTLLGIYEFDGNTMKICWRGQEFGQRPGEFESIAGQSTCLLVYRKR